MAAWRRGGRKLSGIEAPTERAASVASAVVQLFNSCRRRTTATIYDDGDHAIDVAATGLPDSAKATRRDRMSARPISHHAMSDDAERGARCDRPGWCSDIGLAPAQKERARERERER